VFHDATEVTPDGGIPVLSGSVQASLTSRVTRSATIAIPREFAPVEPTDLLSPYQARIRISCGIRYPDGTLELFDLIEGRVYQAMDRDDGACELRIDDNAADVIGLRFERPANSQVDTTVLLEVQRLISEALPFAQFGPHDATDVIVPRLAWDEDRGAALDDLASAVKSRWYCLGNGNFVVRRLPYAGVVPALALSDGPGGHISRATRQVTRDGAANSVTVISERADGSSPIRVTVRDNSPGSPTFYGGPFGRISKVIRPQTPITAGVASDLAQRTLASSLALAEQWSVSMVPLYVLEPGDPISLSYRGRSADQVVDSITYPLTPGDGLMSMESRSVMTEIEQLESF
jgi:hypothetical protein